MIHLVLHCLLQNLVTKATSSKIKKDRKKNVKQLSEKVCVPMVVV